MRLRTIGLISTLALGLLAGPLPAVAQQAGKVYRIAILAPGRPSHRKPSMDYARVSVISAISKDRILLLSIGLRNGGMIDFPNSRLSW